MTTTSTKPPADLVDLHALVDVLVEEALKPPGVSKPLNFSLSITTHPVNGKEKQIVVEGIIPFLDAPL
jgi:hypothetical protein